MEMLDQSIICCQYHVRHSIPHIVKEILRITVSQGSVSATMVALHNDE